MKANVVSAIALAILTATAGAQQLQPVKATKSLVSASPSVTRSLSASFSMLQAVPAKALLVNSVNSDTATVGAKVTARLTSGVKLQNGTVLAHGTRLLGTVNHVTPAAKGTNGTVTLTFDRAELKDGTIVPVKAMIVDVADAYDPADAMDNYNLDPYSPLPTYASVRRIPMDKGLLGVNSELNKSNSGTVVRNGENVSLDEGAQLKLALLAVPASR